MPASAFYCVADARHFLGAVALVNSLRLAGHEEPIFVADRGLTARQSELLTAEATVVPVAADVPPNLTKWALPRIRPARVRILVDADVIVLRPLAPLIERARAGRVAAFADPVSRFFPEWSELLGLEPVEPTPYVNAGIVVLPGERADAILARVAEGQQRVDVRLTMVEHGPSSYPFYYLDQDVWNAVFAATVGPGGIDVLEARLAPHPPFAGLRLVDARTLHCAYADGARPFALHHVGRKPWLAATPSNLYARLLPRLLLAEDVPLRLRTRDLPLRFRPGPSGWAGRRWAEVGALVWSQRGRLGIRRRLAAVVAGRAGSA